MYKSLCDVGLDECYPELLRSSLQIMLDTMHLLPESGNDFKYCAEVPTCVSLATHALVYTYVGKTKFCLSFSYIRAELMYFWVDGKTSFQSDPLICSNVNEAMRKILDEINGAITNMHMTSLQVWAAEVVTAWTA